MLKLFIEKTKKAHKSLTVWFNSAGIATLIMLEGNHALWSEYLGGYSNAALIIIMAVNIGLRYKTTSSMADK